MRGRGRVVCIDLMGGICIGEKEIHLQFGLTCSRNLLVKLQYWQYIAIYFYLVLHAQEHYCHLFIGRKKSKFNVGPETEVAFRVHNIKNVPYGMIL